MKITVNRTTLLKSLDICSNTLGGKVMLNAYHYFLFDVQGDKCYIYGRGEQMQIKTFIPVKSDEDFKFCVPGFKITETIRLLKDEDIILTTKQVEKAFVTTLTIKGKKNRYQNSGINPDEYPVMKVGKDAKGAMINMESLVKNLLRAQLAVDGNNLVQSLAGVNISIIDGKLVIRGANNRFMYKGILDAKDVDINITIPKSTANTVASLPLSPEAKIGTDGTHVIVKSGSVQVTAILINTKYPDTEQFFSKFDQEKYIIIDRQELIKSMKVLKLYSNVENRAMTISVNSNLAILSGEDGIGDASAQEELEVFNSNVEDGFSISINPTFVLPAITNIESDKVKVHLVDERYFTFFTEVSDEVTGYWLVAPVYIAPKQ